MTARWLLPIALPLALAACGGGTPEAKNLDSLDEELAEGISNNAADPMLTSALQDQIMVDPQLTQKSNVNAVRPPAQPYAAPVPSTEVAGGAQPDMAGLKKVPAPAAGGCPECAAASDSVTLGALAARQGGRGAGCAAQMRYAAGWANRLPRDVPLFGSARVIEAAGVQSKACSMRAVSFTVAQPMPAMLDWYYTKLSGAGFSAEHKTDGSQHILGGVRNRDGGAYLLVMTDRDGGGTDIDLIANNGI